MRAGDVRQPVLHVVGTDQLGAVGVRIDSLDALIEADFRANIISGDNTLNPFIDKGIYVTATNGLLDLTVGGDDPTLDELVGSLVAARARRAQAVARSGPCTINFASRGS